MQLESLDKPANLTDQSEFLAGLNDAQRQAVLFDQGPVLVIAGAGSGKTRTLVHRVARLVNEGVDPDSILLLTFTRKASQEMLKRATTLLDARCRNVSGGTFHSFGNMMLRKYAEYIGYTPTFTIFDRADSEDLISMIRKQVLGAVTDKRFPKKGTVADIIGKSINRQCSIRDALGQDFPQFLAYETEISQIADAYQSQKKILNVMDYDDLLTQFLKLLEDHAPVRQELSRRYRYILVDEYQDTNPIQAEIVVQLASEHQNVMVVGDDSQSIYSFRGANFKNIMNFPTLFPEAQVIRLEENYRSTQPVLDLTNGLIENATEKYSKELYTKREGGDLPLYIETQDENEQSRFVVQKVLELREKGVAMDRIAVLFRSGWHSNDLEVELKASNIPFVKHGGFKFTETAHIKDLVAYVRVRHNLGDIVSWQRILLLLEGIGPKGATDLANRILEYKDRPLDMPFDDFKNKAGFPELKKLLHMTFTSPRDGKPIKAVKDSMAFYDPLFKAKYDDYTKRQADLDSLKDISERYEDLESFLSEMSLEPPDASQTGAEAETEDESPLVLSTIHSAKGLEWHTVFLISAIDGYIPSFRSLQDPDQIEEERRLMYVALTRAEDHLYILRPHLPAPGNYYRMAGVHFSKLTRFLEEGDLLKNFADRKALVPEREEEDRSDWADETTNAPSWGAGMFKPRSSKPRKKYNF